MKTCLLATLSCLLWACSDEPASLPLDAGAAPDSGVDARTVDPVDPGDSALVFDESTIRTYDITVASTDWEWLNDNITLEQYVPASLTYDGRTYPQTAIRYKGSWGNLYTCVNNQGQQVCDKLSLKLKFSEYDPEGRFHGLKRVNLHSLNSDDSKLRDAISYKLFRDNGVYAPRTAFARVVINGQLLGLYAVVEAIDGRFTRDRFPDGGEGNLYKEVWPIYDQEVPYLQALKTNEDEQPSADKMLRFAQALAAADDASFESMLASWMDVDQLMRYMAVDRIIDHWDGIMAFYCTSNPCDNHNYYWYESTQEDRIWLVPWDLDNTLQEPSPIRTNYGMPDWYQVEAPCVPVRIFWGIEGLPPSCDKLIRGMATVLWPRYVAASQSLLDGAFAASAMTARIDDLEQLIGPAVMEDPDTEFSSWQNQVQQLRAAVAAKRAYISAIIAQ